MIMALRLTKPTKISLCTFSTSIALCIILLMAASAKAIEVADPQSRPVKYTANRNTIICRQTTDFDEAQEALNQLDMHWFATNPSCRFIKKGAIGYLMKTDIPYSNFCFGTEKSCDLSWGLTYAFDKAHVTPPILAKGILKVCRSQFATDEDFPGDVIIPARLHFIDTGSADFKDTKFLNTTVIVTKKGILKHTEKCTSLPAILVDDSENNGMSAPVSKTLSVSQNRVLGADGIDGQDDKALNLQDLVAYVATDFK